MHEIKKLYRSRDNAVWLGILGGLAEYYGKDPTLFRIIFIALLVLTGLAPFGIIYLLAYFIMPLPPENKN
ncbi:MAG: PspC domain-containing protein [Elusimicrobia bacterium]|nr:PspC domain-containing protein [Elusimicrobiota bacterium]